ncbi:MAG: proline-rich domain-containing protein [Pseudobdellovibrio sp.]
MTKNILFLLAASGLIFTNAGCTSKSADDGSQVVENADVEKIEAESTSAQATDPSLDAALGETTTTTATSEPAVDATAAPTDAAATTSGVTDNNAGSTSTETTTMTTTEGSNPPTTETTSTTMPETPVDTTTAAVDTSATAAGSEITETPITDTTAVEAATTEAKVEPTPVSKPKVAALPAMKKVNAVIPYQGKDGAWINTVYIARPKEKLADISMKIFGADKTSDLKKIAENSYLKSRSVKAGDKVYYTSPNRPDDSTKTMLYYEDMGMVPETYVAKKGESLRKVSKNLLGYDNAWKEVWVSNSTIESKTTLKDGDTLRYWVEANGSAVAAAAPAVGNATLVDSSQAPQPTSQISPPTATETLPPPPTDANANLPPPPDINATQPPTDASTPPPVDAASAATTTDASLPPPADMSPPPPPPPVEEVAEAPKKKVNLDEEAAAEVEGEGLNSDTLMSMGALGVLVALLAFVIIRKKKQKTAAAQAAQMNNEINV